MARTAPGNGYLQRIILRIQGAMLGCHRCRILDSDGPSILSESGFPGFEDFQDVPQSCSSFNPVNPDSDKIEGQYLAIVRILAGQRPNAPFNPCKP